MKEETLIPLRVIYAVLAFSGISLGLAIASTSNTPFSTGLIVGVVLFGLAISVKFIMEIPSPSQQKSRRRRVQ